MSYVTTEQIERAKQMDLLTYLQTYEPQELVHFSGNVFTTRAHDSLKISNGKWCWWSRGIGGRSALDYLIKVRGMTLPDAVIQIDGQAVIELSAPPKTQEPTKPRKLLLPEKNKNNDRVIAYLTGRGINRNLIDYCIETERLYESRPYRSGIPQYATLRGTTNRRYMGEANGSDKHFSFSIPSRKESRRLHLFESAIDLLSYGTLGLISGRDWREDNCLSLAGIYKPKKNIEESTTPAALFQYLKDFCHIKEIYLHLDNDMPGRIAAKTIQAILSPIYEVNDMPPRCGKDVNDYLQLQLGIRQCQEYSRI